MTGKRGVHLPVPGQLGRSRDGLPGASLSTAQRKKEGKRFMLWHMAGVRWGWLDSNSRFSRATPTASDAGGARAAAMAAAVWLHTEGRRVQANMEAAQGAAATRLQAEWRGARLHRLFRRFEEFLIPGDVEVAFRAGQITHILIIFDVDRHSNSRVVERY